MLNHIGRAGGPLYKYATQKRQCPANTGHCRYRPAAAGAWRLVAAGAVRADTGLRTDLLRFEAVAIDAGAWPLVGDREQPDADKAYRHREDGRRSVREQRLGLAEDVHPHRFRHHRQSHCRDQAEEAAHRGAARGAVFPQHRHEQHREVGGGGDRKRQRHHERDVLLLEHDAQHHGHDTEGDGGDFRHAQFVGAGGLALLDHGRIDVMRYRRCAGQGQTRHHGQDGGKGHGRNKAEEHVAAHGLGQVHRRHVVTAQELAGSVLEVRVGAHQNDGAETDDEGEDVEVTDPGGGPQYRLACFFRIRHGEEAHQDVRQAGGAEHQRHAERDRRNRILDEGARTHDGVFIGMDFHCLGKQFFRAKAELRQHRKRHEAGAAEQHHRLDDLYPGRGSHAAEQHVNHHQRAHDDDRDPVFEAEQQFNQLACADHLRDQVKRHHHQRAGSGKDADRFLREAVGGNVGKCEAPQVAQALGHQERDDRPADQESDGVDQAIVTVQEHGGRNTEERCGGHEVAGDGQAVLEARDAATGRVEVGSRFGFGGGPLGDPQRKQDKGAKHADRGPVGGLLGSLAQIGACRIHCAADGSADQGGSDDRQLAVGGAHAFTRSWMACADRHAPGHDAVAGFGSQQFLIEGDEQNVAVIDHHHHRAFHQYPCAAAHDRLDDRPGAVVLHCLRAHPQRARWVAEAYRCAFSPAGGQVHQRAGNRGGRADGHGSGAHHGVVQLAHRERAHQQVDVVRCHRLAAGRRVRRRRRHERHLGRVLAPCRLVQVLDQSHAQRTVGADGFEHGQRPGIAVDRLLQLRARVTHRLRFDENGGNAGVDHGGAQHAHARHVQIVDQPAGGEHRTAGAIALLVGRRIEKFQYDFGGRERDAIEFEVARLLYLAVRHRDMGDDGPGDIGLPDAHHGHAIARDARRVHQACRNRKRAHGGRQVAAVAAPVHERLVDGHLAEQVVDVMIGPVAGGQDHGLAGAGRAVAHAVDLFAVGVGAADHAQQQRVARGAWGLRGRRQEVLGEALQHAARFVDRYFFGRIEPADHGHLHPLAGAAPDHQREHGARRALADHVKGLGAIEFQRQAIDAGREFQRQHAHAHQVGAVDALETFGGDGLHAGQPHALGGPVARRALAVVGAGDHDQRLLALHVGFDGLPHAGDFPFRFHPRQRARHHLAVGPAHHLVLERGVGKGGALRGEVIAPVGGVGIEVLFRQSHFGQVLAGRAVGHDGVGRRQVIGGDVIAQQRQRPHARQRTLARQRALPVRRAADVCGVRAPVVQGAHRHAIVHLAREHRDIHLAELLGLDAGRDDGVDFRVRRPDVRQPDGCAVGIGAQYVFFDIEADGAGNRVRHHQRRRRQERLLGVRVDAAVEIAVARQDGGGIQVALDHFLLDHGIERAGHAVARRAGISHHAEAQLFQLRHQARFFQVQGNGLGAWRQRRFHPWFAGESPCVGIPGQQAGSDHVARVVGVGAAGNGRDDAGAVGHLAGRVVHHAAAVTADAARGQLGRGHAAVRIRRAGDIAHHRRQIEGQHALVPCGGERIGPQAGLLRIGFHQLHGVLVASRQAQVPDGLLVDVEHGGRGAVFGRHVGDGGAVAQGQVGGARAVKLQVRRHHFLLAQKFGERQHGVGGGDAFPGLAGQLHADDVGQPHPRCAAQHHAFRFQPAHADGDHAQRIDHGRVRVGADQRIGKGHAVLRLDHGRHAFEVNLVQDAVPGRDHVHILERLLGPLDEIEAVLVAAVLDGAVFGEGVGIETAAFHGQRMVHHQLRGHHRVDQRRVAALQGDGVAQAGQVHQRGLAEDIVAYHARGEPGEIEVAAALDQLRQRSVERGRVAAAHQVFGQHARGVRQFGPGAGRDGIDGFARIEVFGAHIVGARADDLVVDTLLDHVRGPAGRARNHEQRREHGGGHAHHVVRHGREPVQVGEHLLDIPHHGLQAFGNVEHLQRAAFLRQLARHVLDHHIARIGNRVHGVAEADHHFLVGYPVADVGFRFVGIFVALLDLERELVGAAVLGTAQRADGAGDGRMDVGTGTRDHAAGKGGRIEFVFRIQDQRCVHGLHPAVGRLEAVQQVQEVAADGIVVGFHLDALAVMAVVVPVQQHGAKRRHQAVGDVACARHVVVVLFRQHAAQHRHAGAHHVHRMGGRRQRFQRRLHGLRQAAQRAQFGLVAAQLAIVGQFAMHQQVGDFLELAGGGQVQDVVAARIELLFEAMVIDALIELRARLHGIEHILLGAVAADRAVHVFGRLVHGAERGQRIQHQSHVGAAQLVHRKQRRGAKFGDIGQYRHFDGSGKLFIHIEADHRFREDHVGARLHARHGALDGRVQPLDGQGVGAGHDHELFVGARIDGGADAVDHFLLRDDLLAGPVAAALGAHLVFDVHGGRAGLDHRLDGARDIESGGAESGIGIHQQRQIADVGNAAHVAGHLDRLRLAPVRPVPPHHARIRPPRHHRAHPPRLRRRRAPYPRTDGRRALRRRDRGGLQRRVPEKPAVGAGGRGPFQRFRRAAGAGARAAGVAPHRHRHLSGKAGGAGGIRRHLRHRRGAAHLCDRGRCARPGSGADGGVRVFSGVGAPRVRRCAGTGAPDPARSEPQPRARCGRRRRGHPARAPRHHRPARGLAGDGSGAAVGGAVREVAGHGADPGRDGQRQGARRAGDPPRGAAQPGTEPAVRGGQLRRHRRIAAGVGTVRPRGRCVHGRAARRARRFVRGGRPRHAVPRRDRRNAAGAANAPAAGAGRARGGAGGRHPADPGRCAHHQRHPLRPGAARARRPLPRRPVLPAGRVAPVAAAAAGAARRHHKAGRMVAQDRTGVAGSAPASQPACGDGRVRAAAARVRVAGQCARAAQCRRAPGAVPGGRTAAGAHARLCAGRGAGTGGARNDRGGDRSCREGRSGKRRPATRNAGRRHAAR
uniref:Uncharacterized protein n=1 Tax=Tanacetum cinerariifolium TaxID=118510 RepID=A0A699GIS9_TANCI|nr:hypothetical protein [Tanacetum cinerariifolium]